MRARAYKVTLRTKDKAWDQIEIVIAKNPKEIRKGYSPSKRKRIKKIERY